MFSIYLMWDLVFIDCEVDCQKLTLTESLQEGCDTYQNFSRVHLLVDAGRDRVESVGFFCGTRDLGLFIDPHSEEGLVGLRT